MEDDSSGELTLPFRQMVWYENCVWATSDYGVWQIIGDDVVQPDLPSEVKMCTGYISCTEKTTVLAGYYGVARLENGHWDILINCVQAEKGDFVLNSDCCTAITFQRQDFNFDY